MSGVLAYELRRSFGGDAFRVSLTVAVALALAQLATVPAQYASAEIWARWRSGAFDMPPNVWCSWMGATSYSVWSTLFYFLTPLLSCAPFAASLYADLKGHQAIQLLSRSDAISYLRAKAVSSCACAVVVVILPQLINLFGTILFVPMLHPDPAAGIFPIASKAELSDLFYTNPWAYWLAFMLIDATVASECALFSLVLAFCVRSRLLALALPFLACVGIDFMLFPFALSCYAPGVIVQPYQTMPGLNLGIAGAVYFALGVAELAYLGKKAKGLDAL